MTELEIMQRAKQYIDALANGFDPLTGQRVREDDVINQVRISRCLFYVSGVLQRVIDNGGEVKRVRVPRAKKQPFSVTPAQTAQLTPSPTAISTSRIVGMLNGLIDTEQMQKLKRSELIGWLLSVGLLQGTETPGGKTRKVPTQNGEMLGMKDAVFVNEQGIPVHDTVYDQNAQQFIFDNMESVIAFLRSSEAEGETS